MLDPTKKRYPMSKGQSRSPTKMVGEAKSHLESNPISTRDVLLLLLLLSCFSHVQLCATPEMASPPGSPIPGILQAITLEWVAISFSSA